MDLHKEFVKLSFDIIRMKNRLISLLLEIYEKEIYKQHHCRTIHEYGFKYAKLSKEMVDKSMRTLKHLENKPFLKKAIETQGIHKVAMVATIATPENERILAGHVENLSKPALFEFSKELRWKQQNEKLPRQKAMFHGQAMTVGQIENSVPGNGIMKQPEVANNSKPISKTTFPSRYIQKKKGREIRAKYQHKCAYPGCVKTIEVMHHRVPFAFERSHESIIPLCDIHHEFAHNGVIGHELKEPKWWTLKITGSKSIYDSFYLNKKTSRTTGD